MMNWRTIKAIITCVSSFSSQMNFLEEEGDYQTHLTDEETEGTFTKLTKFTK